MVMENLWYLLWSLVQQVDQQVDSLSATQEMCKLTDNVTLQPHPTYHP